MDYRKTHTLTWPAVVALALAMTLAAVFFASYLRSNADTPLSSVVRLNTLSSRDVQVSGAHVFYQEGGSLHCVTSSGEYVWNLGVDADSSFMASEYGVAVWNRKKLTLVERATGHLLTSKTMDAEVLSACVGETYAAAVLGPEHESTVVLMDTYGAVVDTLSDFNGLTVLDFGFFSGRELFWLMTLDSSGSTPTCTISTYKPGKRVTGSITDMEQVLYQVMFRSSQIAAVGTTYLRVYDYVGAEQTAERVTVYGWYLESVDKQSENPLMLFVPNAQVEGEQRITDVRMIRGTSESIVHLPALCTRLEASGNVMYGFSEEHLVMCSFGQIQATVYNLPVLVDNVIGITSDKAAVVTSGGSIFLIRLP